MFKRSIIPSFLFHVMFWVLFLVAFAASEWNYWDNFGKAVLFESLFLPSRIIAAYLFWFILIPRYLYSNKVLIFSVLSFVLLLALTLLQRAFVLYYAFPTFFPDFVKDQSPSFFDFGKIVQNILVISTPVAIMSVWKVYTDLRKKQTLNQILEKEKIDSELRYLKSQVNPHFLFNTLNNIYSLALENSEKTAELILKLSDFLSFSIYESNQKLIPIEKEIALMKDFIALEKSRFEDRVKVALRVDVQQSADVLIPPLIFVPFVENAFKHGLMNETEMAEVDIVLEQHPNRINFKVSNSKPKNQDISKRGNGSGLINIRKRLEILYGEKYDLQIDNRENRYTVTLEIDL